MRLRLSARPSPAKVKDSQARTRRAGYLLESFELLWGPAGLAATAVSAASAVDHRLEKGRSVQPDSDIIATSARTSSQSSTFNLMNASSEASLSTAPARTLWTRLCSSISVAVPRITVRSRRACTWKDSLFVLPRICRCVILLCSLMCFDSCRFCICSLNYCGLNLCALSCTRNFLSCLQARIFRKSYIWCTFWLHQALCHQNVICGVFYSSRKNVLF